MILAAALRKRAIDVRKNSYNSEFKICSYNNRCLDVHVVIMHTQLRTISEDNKSYVTFFFLDISLSK